MTVRRLTQNVEKRSGMVSSPNGWGWADPAAIPPPGLYSMQRAGVPVTAHTSLQVDAVFTSLRVLSNAIIKMGDPLAFTYQTDGQNRRYRKWMSEADTPAILKSTWGDKWQFDGMSRTIVSLALFGECFWYTLTTDDMQRPTALEVLHPALIEMKKGDSGHPEFWYGMGVNRVKLDKKKLTHIPFMALPGDKRGLNSIEYAGIAYALALAAMEYGQRWFSQGASPSYILSTDQSLGREEVERIAQKFFIEHSGLQAAHLPLVVDSGLKVQKTQSTPDEAQFINTLEYARMCIAAWFGLPSHLIGGTADKGMVWGKTIEEQGIQLVDFTLSGYITRIEEALSSMLPAGVKCCFDVSTIQQASSADLAAEITAMRTMSVMTQNDVRVMKLNMPPIPDGDDINAPLASNVAPAPAAAAAKAQNADNAGTTDNNVTEAEV